MGWPAPISTNSKSAEDGTEKLQSVESVKVEPTPSIHDIKRAEILGAAHILANWPLQLARAVLWLLLGVALGILFAVLLRLVIPCLINPSTPMAAPLHVVASNLTKPRACALEALTRTNAHRPCNFVLLHSHPDSTIELVYHLQDSYPNLNTKYHPDPDDFFESSPLNGFSRFGGTGELLELAARTLSLWRHGGVSVDLDRPVFDLPSSDKYVTQGDGALLQFPKPCHPALQGLLAALGSDLQSSAEDALNRATNWICKINMESSISEDSEEKEEVSTTPPKPEQCLGVSVLPSDNKENFHQAQQCPIVTALHDEHNFPHDGNNY